MIHTKNISTILIWSEVSVIESYTKVADYVSISATSLLAMCITVDIR